MAFKSPRSAKAKGTRYETEVAKSLAAASGCEGTRRQPGSGAIQGFHGDVLHDPRGWELSIECKHRASIPGYDRLERARLTNDGLIVDTPAGLFYWLSDEFFLELIARAYGQGGKGELVPTFSTLKTGKAMTSFNGWMKGCSALAVKPNHGKTRWYLPSNVYEAARTYAARAEFDPYKEAA